MYTYRVHISHVSSADCTIYIRDIETHSFYSLISSGKNSIFAQSAPAIGNNCNLAFIVSTRYPSLLGRQRQYDGADKLPGTSTHDQRWQLNPRPFDL